MIDVNNQEEKMELIDYLFSNSILSENEYKVALFIQKSYRKQKHFKTSSTFSSERVDGGKPDKDAFYNVIIANEDWERICFDINNETKNILDIYIGRECITKNIYNKDFENTINKVIQAIDIVMYNLRLYLKLKFSSVELKLLLKTLIEIDGISKLSKSTGIGRSSIYRILNTNNYQYNTYIQLLEHYDLVSSL